MTLEWFLSALAVSHVIGTLTFFFISLANIAIYNKQWSDNLSSGYVFSLLWHCNKWPLAWHQGLKLFIWGVDDDEEDEEN
ncbi:hypothetical protein PODOV061v2_0044 [Vibrio phage 172P1]|nr:hypothetical protein PODOV061v2_0044 [Vibrio phage 172P1]